MNPRVKNAVASLAPHDEKLGERKRFFCSLHLMHMNAVWQSL